MKAREEAGFFIWVCRKRMLWLDLSLAAEMRCRKPGRSVSSASEA
jgi:hypothetical protein